MASLTRDDILGAPKVHVEEMDVPELGGTVFVRAMTGAEWNSIEQAIMKKELSNWRARLAAICLSDEEGNRLFKDSDTNSLASKLPHVALDRIADKAFDVNRLKNAGIEEIEGN